MAITEKKMPLQWWRELYGLSTDVKPVGVPIGSRFTESDTGNIYETANGTIWFLIVA